MAYEKHTWQSNELVTAEKLNHIEEGLDRSVAWDKAGPSNIVSFSDAMATNAIDVMVDIKPDQFGSGDPSPSNIRAIGGWTSANITVSSSQSGSENDTTYNITLPLTVYGGTLDVTKGELVADMAMITLIGIEGWSQESDLFKCSLASSLRADGSNVGISSHYKWSTTSSSEYDSYHIKNKTVYISNKNHRFSSLGEFTSYLSSQSTNGTPVQICYKLADPITYNLTPTQIALLAGTNYVQVNCGDITVEYLRDSNLNINHAIAAQIEKSRTSSLITTIPSGQWSGSNDDYYITISASNVTADSILVPQYDEPSSKLLKGPVWCVPGTGSFTIHTSVIPAGTVTIMVMFAGTMGEAQYQVLDDVYSTSQTDSAIAQGAAPVGIGDLLTDRSTYFDYYFAKKSGKLVIISFFVKKDTPDETTLFKIDNSILPAQNVYIAPLFYSNGQLNTSGSVWIEHKNLSQATYYGATATAGSYATLVYMTQ